MIQWQNDHAPENSGGVTVDLDRRRHALGFGTVASITDKQYEGRGWLDRLVADAVGSLTAVWKARRQ